MKLIAAIECVVVMLIYGLIICGAIVFAVFAVGLVIGLAAIAIPIVLIRWVAAAVLERVTWDE